MKNYATGQRNGMARDADSIVRIARRLRSSGLGYRRIAAVLAPAAGRDLSRQTVRNWITGSTRSQA